MNPEDIENIVAQLKELVKLQKEQARLLTVISKHLHQLQQLTEMKKGEVVNG